MRYKGREYNGEGVTVAVIDSGINAEDPRLAASKVDGWRVRLRATNHVVVDGLYSDKIGHGTNIAAAITSAAPGVSFLAVRIMDDKLRVSADLMAVGIETAYKSGAHIINLSLGTPDMGKAMLLRDCCAMARDAGVIMVASGHPKGGRAYPADIPEAIGVVSNADCVKRHYYFDPAYFPRTVWKGLSKKIMACGRQDTQDKESYQGAGLAAARITAELACLRQALPDSSVAELIDILRLQCALPTVELGYC